MFKNIIQAKKTIINNSKITSVRLIDDLSVKSSV